jgi:hypothetical protein
VPQYFYVPPPVITFTDTSLPSMEAGWDAEDPGRSPSSQEASAVEILFSLGEVMLRFDRGEYRIWTARNFRSNERGR